MPKFDVMVVRETVTLEMANITVITSDIAQAEALALHEAEKKARCDWDSGGNVETQIYAESIGSVADCQHDGPTLSDNSPKTSMHFRSSSSDFGALGRIYTR